MENIKACKHCKVEKPIEDYSSPPSHKGYIYATCKVCVLEQKRHGRKNNNQPCRSKDRLRAQENVNRTRQPERYMLKNVRSHARKINVPFSITREHIMIPEFCPVLGIKINCIIGKRGKSRDDSPSTDRLIPSKGYIPGNIQVISNRANQIKSYGTIEEHELIIQYINEPNIVIFQSEENLELKYYMQGERFRGVMASAKSRSLEFDLNRDEIIIPKLCPIFGIPLEKGIGLKTDNSPSFDRIDSNKGYVKGNVRIISNRANTVKNNGTAKEHELIVKYMVETSPHK